MRSHLVALCLLVAAAVQAQPCDVEVIVTQPTCPGDLDGSIVVNTISGGPYTYTWSHDGTLTTATATNLVADAYSVQVSDGLTCDTLIDVIVADLDVPPLGSLAVTHISCAGATDGAITFTPSGSDPWIWAHAPAETSTALTNLPGNNYAVIVTPPVGCPSILNVFLGDPGIVITGEPLVYCPSAPPVLTAELTYGFQPDIYDWSTGDSTQIIQIVAGITGTVTLTATDTTIGCVVDVQVDLDQLPTRFAVPTMVDSACMNVAFIVNTLATDADSLVWSWNNGLNTSNARDPLVSFTSPGWQSITLQAFDSLGCGNVPVQDSIFIIAQVPAIFTAVQVPCTPWVDIVLGSTADSCAFFIGDSLVSNDCEGFIRWDHHLYDFYDYTLYATQRNGCNDTLTTTIDVRTEPTLFLANAFTPNDDGINDLWPVRTEIADLGFELRLFDRWGESIWVTNNPLDQWDGQLASGQAPMGVYVYTMKMRDPCSPTNEITKTGHVTVFR